jgi:hypothetical protein
MRSKAWYEANSFCWDGTRHEGDPVLTLDGDRVGYLCVHCLERVNRVRRGSDLWVLV